MERIGLVSRVEEQLERMISLGQLPEDGCLPSEQLLARRYGVSRATLREALLRLSVRGLVVQRSGRRTRAVALDEAVTLENLGAALHGEGSSHPERRRLLDGYFALKREMAVELLVACCEHASQSDLELLKEACFALKEAARWEAEGRGWVKREFDLLRLAARVADRPGHFLLIQSLERSFWGMAARVLPHLDSEAIHEWAQCAFHALGERDAQALRRELLPLLQACDEHALGGPPLASDADGAPQARHSEAELRHEAKPEPAPTRAGLSETVSPNLSCCLTGSGQAPPAASLQPEAPPAGSRHLPDRAADRGHESHPLRCLWVTGLCPPRCALLTPASPVDGRAECPDGPFGGDTLQEPGGPPTCEARGCPDGQHCIHRR